MTRRVLPPAEIALRGLDAMEVILATPDRQEGGEHAKSMLAGLDEQSLRRVAAFLADVAVWALSRGRKPGAAARFIERQRLEATAQLTGGRR